MLKKNDLIDYFYKGIKDKNDLRIGVEHEKFVLKKDSLQQLSYEESNGIKDILLKFVNKGWKPKYDDKNTTIIALERFGESITLEPGGQLELSGAQFLKQLEKKREASKKDWNRNVFTVRTNDDISSMIKEYCQINNISTNRFLNDLLNSYFK